MSSSNTKVFTRIRSAFLWVILVWKFDLSSSSLLPSVQIGMLFGILVEKTVCKCQNKNVKYGNIFFSWTQTPLLIVAFGIWLQFFLVGCITSGSGSPHFHQYSMIILIKNQCYRHLLRITLLHIGISQLFTFNKKQVMLFIQLIVLLLKGLAHSLCPQWNE